MPYVYPTRDAFHILIDPGSICVTQLQSNNNKKTELLIPLLRGSPKIKWFALKSIGSERGRRQSLAICVCSLAFSILFVHLKVQAVVIVRGRWNVRNSRVAIWGIIMPKSKERCDRSVVWLTPNGV